MSWIAGWEKARGGIGLTKVTRRARLAYMLQVRLKTVGTGDVVHAGREEGKNDVPDVTAGPRPGIPKVLEWKMYGGRGEGQGTSGGEAKRKPLPSWGVS